MSTSSSSVAVSLIPHTSLFTSLILHRLCYIDQLNVKRSSILKPFHTAGDIDVIDDPAMYDHEDKQGHYQALPENEETPAVQLSQRSIRRSSHIFSITAALIAAFVLAVVCGALLGSAIPIRSLLEPKPRVTNCGRTSSEARARGCVLEPMVYGWMPPQCQFAEVTKQNDPFTKWQWYADENMTQPLTEEQLWRGESINLWTNRPGYHLEHCLFLYRKLMYGMENNVRWLDRKTLGAHHAYHCVGQLSTGTEAWNATTWTGLGMYSCDRTPWS